VSDNLDETLVRSSEETKVFAYRLRMLAAAGCSPINAELLAHTRTDLRTLVRALERGCPPDLALRIFD